MRVTIACAATALTLLACSTTPGPNPALEDARNAVNAAQSDPAVNNDATATVELQKAREALGRAEEAWNKGHDDEGTRSLAYVARQRAAIARELGTQYTAERRLQQAGVERERIRAEAREREALAADQRARSAQQQAASAQQQAASAQQQAAGAQAQAEAERENARRLKSELEQLAAKNTTRGMVLTLQDVLFDTGQATLRPGADRTLERLAGVMKGHPEVRILVEGFADSRGSDSYNLDLSQRRADTVGRMLTKMGVPPDRIETRAYGESYPIATNDTPAGRQLNRRVEIVFSDAQGKIPPR